MTHFSQSRNLLVGLGNPLRGDDGVGLVLAEKLGEWFPALKVLQAPLAGLELIEDLTETDRFYVIDALAMERPEELEVQCWRSGETCKPPSLASCHGLTIFQILDLARQLGFPGPGSWLVFGVPVESSGTVTEGLSDALRGRLPVIVQQIARFIADDFSNSDDTSGKSRLQHSFR